MKTTTQEISVDDDNRGFLPLLSQANFFNSDDIIIHKLSSKSLES
jgi:hypothetical protein